MPAFWHLHYKRGDKVPEVKWIKWALQDKGYYSKDITVNNVFGTGTEAAVKKFQKANGLKQDGIVGPTTAKKHDPKIKHNQHKSYQFGHTFV